MTYNEHRQQMDYLRKLGDHISRLERKIDSMAAGTQAGLASLTQAQTDLAAAVTANTAAEQALVQELASLQQQLANVPQGDPDGQVASIAADMETKIAALQKNTADMQAALTPASSSSSSTTTGSPAQTTGDQQAATPATPSN